MEAIKQQFDKVIKHSQAGITEPKTDKLFQIWLENKQDIIRAFGDRLIYEFPEKVSFEVTDELKKQRVQNFINYIWEIGYDSLGRFLDHQKDGFYLNQVIEEYNFLGKIITKGTKLLKAFKYFISDEQLLHQLQDKASMILQENKIEGTLCFSVHPLDYLSISENTYNWRSCHALDGEYRAGNLSYMMDKSTIVCYLKGEDQVKLPNFPEDVLWNSKKWRVLLYLSNDWTMIYAGKQYPFSSDSGMKMLIDKCFNKKICLDRFEPWCRPMSAKWTDWTSFSLPQIRRELNDKEVLRYDLYYDYIPLSCGFLKLNTLVKDIKGSKHFNDVLKSSCYTPIYTQMINRQFNDEFECLPNLKTRFEIGEYTYCLRCGEAEVMDSCSTMMCYDCELRYGVSENEDFGFCAECGARIATENACYVDDEVYCPTCYHDIAETCENCGDSYLRQDMVYDEKNDIYLCRWCI